MFFDEWKWEDARKVWLKEGEETENERIAYAMKNENVDLNAISRITGLTTDEILKLKTPASTKIKTVDESKRYLAYEREDKARAMYGTSSSPIVGMLMAEFFIEDTFSVCDLVGAEKGRERIAPAMKAEGMDVDTISRLTGLTVDDVLRL
jgi:hypothetical protein